MVPKTGKKDFFQMSEQDKIQSPLNLAEQVNQLMKLPQHLCKQRGICCKVATFKGSLSYPEIEALAKTPASPDQKSAQDFISLFLPYQNQEEVSAISGEFVQRVRAMAGRKGQNPDEISFFKCKYVLDSGQCSVHEDRPLGCRMYPFPHENTLYHPGCGFEEQGKANWKQIELIIERLENSLEKL
jgi:Fe-S-cluster containining protein